MFYLEFCKKSIKDLADSLTIKVHSTPLIIDFIEPSIIVCSGSSSIEKQGTSYKIKSDRDGEMYTPDINKLFNSFVPFTHDFDLSVLIMTGIGSDGVQGAKNLHAKGAKIYAQDKESSPVYGMPKAAYEAGILEGVKTFDEIVSYFKGV